MKIKPLPVPLLALLLSACAGTTPPPRFSVLDPADPKAPESAVEPRSTLLERPPEQPTASPAASEPTLMGHEHHTESPPGQASNAADVYSCPTHSQVREAKPGKCSICGTTLVKQPPKPHEEHPR
jgi:hypothetical protein